MPVSRCSYIHPSTRSQANTEDTVRETINKMITCIKAGDYVTAENTAEEAGYSSKDAKTGGNPVVLHVGVVALVEERGFMGLMKKEVRRMAPICLIRFDSPSWKIHEKDIFNTERLSELYRHLKYYDLDVQVEGVPKDTLNTIYIETRKDRSGAIDLPVPEIDSKKDR